MAVEMTNIIKGANIDYSQSSIILSRIESAIDMHDLSGDIR
jgi:hypothetical protein